MSSALNKALAALDEVSTEDVCEHAKTVARVVEALAREHQALGAIVERQDHRLITLETWSSAQTVEEPLAPRIGLPHNAPASEAYEALQRSTRVLDEARSTAPDSAVSWQAQEVRKQFAAAFKALGWAEPDEVQRLRQAIDDSARAAAGQRDRLAADALAALSAAGIATPEGGYAREPQCLSSNIEQLAKERDEAVARAEQAEKTLRDLDRMIIRVREALQ